jgi:hypothetical protein
MRGVRAKEAKRRAWATENAMSGVGKNSGSGRGQDVNEAPAEKDGPIGGHALAARPKTARSASTKKATKTPAKRAR